MPRSLKAEFATTLVPKRAAIMDQIAYLVLFFFSKAGTGKEIFLRIFFPRNPGPIRSFVPGKEALAELILSVHTIKRDRGPVY